MRDRLSQNDVTNQVNVEDPRAVNAAVRAIFERRYPGKCFGVLDRVFDDFNRLFTGAMPGYQACDTLYHDLRHTLEVTLAMARLIDGHDRVRSGTAQLGPGRALLGVVVALLHDSGYIRSEAERDCRNGAEFTPVHVSRSAKFLEQYLPRVGLGARVELASQIVHFTGYEIEIADIVLDSELDRRLGYLLGSADLIGQMSDRLYLEKCRDFLYPEFVLGGIAPQDYCSAEDLLRRTLHFHDVVVDMRLNRHFEGAHRYVEAHFGTDNPYGRTIRGHIDFLRGVIAEGDFQRLRRRAVSLSGRRGIAAKAAPVNEAAGAGVSRLYPA